MRIFRVIRDIQNWFYIKKTIKQLKATPDWKKYNLTHDWIYRIGAVINMRKEDFGEQTEIHQARFLDFARPVFEYIGEKFDPEILVPNWYRIGENYAYLIVFHQRMTGLSFWYVLSRLVIIISLIIGVLYFYK